MVSCANAMTLRREIQYIIVSAKQQPPNRGGHSSLTRNTTLLKGTKISNATRRDDERTSQRRAPSWSMTSRSLWPEPRRKVEMDLNTVILNMSASNVIPQTHAMATPVGPEDGDCIPGQEAAVSERDRKRTFRTAIEASQQAIETVAREEKHVPVERHCR
jgi:hypothetical protein